MVYRFIGMTHPTITLNEDCITQALDRVRARRSLPSAKKRRWLRERAGLSQAVLAQALGTTTVTISRWEAGTRMPRGPRLAAYRALLDRLAAEAHQ
jgi:DNA-binding transcriptional regulator YiaG